MRLTSTQLSNLLVIHSNTRAGVRVTSQYGAYWLSGVLFEIGGGAMSQLYRKGVIEDGENGVNVTIAGLAAVEAHNETAHI